MGGIWKTSLGLALSLLASTALAEEPAWKGVPIATSRPKKSADSSDAPVKATSLAPAVSLDGPVPLPKDSASRNQVAGQADASVKPAGFSNPIIRAQSTDEPKPLPTGPSIWGEALSGFTLGSKRPVSSGFSGGQIVATSGKPVSLVDSNNSVPIESTGVPITMGPAGCESSSCGSCNSWWPKCWTCCPQTPNSLYINTEYLMWWVKGDKVPPLVTTGSLNDLRPGALGQPGTVVLFGGQPLEPGSLSGARLTVGYWFDDCHQCGIEGSFFFLNQGTRRFAASSNGTPLLARPFFNAQGNFEDAELVAAPGVIMGGVAASHTTSLLGAEANFRSNLCSGCCYNIDFLAGFRYLGLDENLSISENLVSANPAIPGAFLISDRFSTHNQFFGGQVGFDSELRWRRFFADVKTKIALGSTHETVNIQGNTIVTNAGTANGVFPGGLLTQTTNIGRFSREMFSVAPEVGVNLGYQINDCVRCYVGYNVLYISNVARPGNQIDRVVNTSFLPPPTPSLPARPAFEFKGTEFWAQGINFGLEFKY